MAAGQQFLIAPERPLVTRLGAEFFRQIPAQPGVYKMHDGKGTIIYVGKARDLRKRLCSYRVANPERLGRRHLRLLNQVTRIEFDLCESESAALKHEAKLIRELKPKFNRAGVWPGKPQFLIWRLSGSTIEMCVRETPMSGWKRLGRVSGAVRLKCVLARLLWMATDSKRRAADLPCGWIHNRMADVVTVENANEAAFLLTGVHEAITAWFVAQCQNRTEPFDAMVISNDIEELQQFLERIEKRQRDKAQLALL